MAKITIFGLAGTGKSTAGKMLADKLGYEYNSTGNMYRQMAKDYNMTLNEFEVVADADDKYDRELDEVKVTEYGRDHDNFVLESRLAWHFIPESFKIKFDCDFDTRTARVAQRENKIHEQVKEETLHREDIHSEKYNKYYDIVDYANNKNFDFIVDTKVNNAEQVTAIILEELKKRGII